VLEKIATIVFIALIATGCAVKKNGVHPVLENENGRSAVERAAMNWNVEYYSPKDLAMQEVMKSPTVFPILHEEDYYVWERAKIYLNKYTKGIGWENEINGITILTSDAENTDERFHYQISKKMNPDGYIYTVNCYTWDHQETPTSLLNAKNLSRFMRRGELEADLIVN